MAAQAHIETSALESVLERFGQRHPLRAGSLVVTVFGDAIVPRGGSLWLGSLLEIMALFRIEPGLVRTALSRLVQENWFQRSRGGRSSFYRLSESGAATFADATRRIYHAQDPAWDGSLRLALLTAIDGRGRAQARDRLTAQGFGQSAPTVLLRPAPADTGPEPDIDGAIWLSARMETDPQTARRLGAACWQLDAVAQSYARFIETFNPLLAPGRGRSQNGGLGGGSGASLSTGLGTDLDEAHAFRLRILLVHEYRRIILRDPLLPRAMLPGDWPGLAARRVCRQLYKTILPRSEAWLDAHAQAQSGPLPAPDEAFGRRFGGR